MFFFSQHAFDYAQSSKLNVTCKCHFLAKFYNENLNLYNGLKVKIDLD